MSINVKCPKCGSTKVQLSDMQSKHGLIKFLFLGFFYIMWWICKAVVAVTILICFDWWWEILQRRQGKSYSWISRKLLEFKKKYYYCHKCGHNFRG